MDEGGVPGRRRDRGHHHRHPRAPAGALAVATVSPRPGASGRPGSASPRDLVLVTAGLELDGGGRAVVGRLLAAHLARIARERGVGFEVLSLGDAPPPVPVPRFRGAGGSPRRLAARVLGRHLRSPRPALVYDLLGPARIEAVVPAPLAAPYALTMLGVEVWTPLDRLRCRALAGAALRLAISRHTERRARQVVADCLGAVEPLPLTLEGRPPEGEVDRELVAGAGDGFLLCVGRMSTLEVYKGHDVLLETLPALLARRPGARIVFAGGGDDRRRLETKAAALGLGAAATFTGFVSEATLAALYERCRALVLPSRGEGFGLVYLEAMRAGKPCVAEAGGAAAEVVADGETGLLVDSAAGDGSALIAACERLLTDEGFAARLGAAGRDRFHRLFSGDLFHRRLAAYADRLIAL